MTNVSGGPPQAPATPEARPGQGESPRLAPEADLAPPWRRLLGFLVDALILTLATGALWGRLLASFASRLGNALAPVPPGTRPDPGAVGRVFGHTVAPYLIEVVFTICVAVLYYWLLTGYGGATIGKRSVGTRVVSARDHCEVSLRAAFWRAVVFVAGGELIPLFFPADSLWLTGDRRRQCLHDKAARTLVVRSRAARPRDVPLAGGQPPLQ